MNSNPSYDHARAATLRRMMWFFAIVYIAEGWAQTGGVIKQPLYNYLYNELHWDAGTVAGYLWWLNIPWWIKWLYGMISDSCPLFGYRRKSYLLLANTAAVIAYLALGFTTSTGVMLACLITITAAMAVSSALCGALVVEQAKHAHDDNPPWQHVVRSNVATVGAAGMGGWLFQLVIPIDVLQNAHFVVLGGEMIGGLLVLSACVSIGTALRQRFTVDHHTHSPVASKFLGQQALWASMATILAAFAGGWLAQTFAPIDSLHNAAFFAIGAPVLVVLFCWPLVSEEKATTDMQHLKEGLRAMGQAVRTRELWAVAGFLALWAFNPAFGSVMYKHMNDTLHFQQLFIGQLWGYMAIGGACGALLYMKVISRMFSVRTLAAVIIVLGAATQLSFIWMADSQTAIVLYVLNGALTAMAGINAHVIAARSCPDHAEGFMYSTLLAISNISWSTSDWIGGVLYTHQFQGDMTKLIALSAGTTLACLALLGLLRLKTAAQPPQH